MIAADLIGQVVAAGGQIRSDGTGLVLTAASPLPADLLADLKAHKPAEARRQKVLAMLARSRGALLREQVFEPDGRALTPWFTRKKSGRLYRYYLPTRENKEHAGASGLPRLPAAELEAAVLEQLRGLLRAPGILSLLPADS